MAVETLVATAAIGTAVSIYGQRKASKEREAAAIAMANIKNQQAADLMERFEINATAFRQKGEGFKAEQISSFIKGGVASGEGSTLLALENTNRIVTRTLELDRMEVESQANALRAGAEIDVISAGDIASSRDMESLGLFLTGASRVAAGSRGLK